MALTGGAGGMEKGLLAASGRSTQGRNQWLEFGMPLASFELALHRPVGGRVNAAPSQH